MCTIPGSGPQWSSIAVFLHFLTLLTLSSAAANINADCGQWIREVNLALDEAIAIADYASKRFNNIPADTADPPDLAPRKGNLMMDMLGAPNENDADTFAYAQPWFTAARDVAQSSSLEIHCGDAYLRSGGPGRFFDDNYPGAPAIITGGCASGVRAYEYDPLQLQNHVIVLCTTGNGALAQPLRPVFGTVDNYDSDSDGSDGSDVGADLRMSGWWAQPTNPARQATVGVNVFGSYLSYKLLHELMHAANSLQFPLYIMNDPTGTTGRTRELYEFNAITGRALNTDPNPNGGGPSAYVRQRNADSFALLGCAWYLPPFVFKNGVIRVAPPKFQPPEHL